MFVVSDAGEVKNFGLVMDGESRKPVLDIIER
jgi:hypothetical protein